MCLQERHGEQTREMHRYDLTRFVFVALLSLSLGIKGKEIPNMCCLFYHIIATCTHLGGVCTGMEYKIRKMFP